MTSHEIVLLLCGVLLGGGFALGWLARGAWDRPYDDDPEDVLWPDLESSTAHLAPPQAGGTSVSGAWPEHPYTRRTVVLEPGPTIYPALAALAAEDVPRPSVVESAQAGPGHWSPWAEALTMAWSAEFPIPGTPQWESRHAKAMAG